MNGKITLTKEKYQELVEKAGRFEVIQKLAADGHDFFQEPTTKSTAVIIKEMEKTGLYSKSFLKSLGLGFRKSTYFSK